MRFRSLDMWWVVLSKCLLIHHMHLIGLPRFPTVCECVLKLKTRSCSGFDPDLGCFPPVSENTEDMCAVQRWTQTEVQIGTWTLLVFTHIEHPARRSRKRVWLGIVRIRKWENMGDTDRPYRNAWKELFTAFRPKSTLHPSNGHRRMQFIPPYQKTKSSVCFVNNSRICVEFFKIKSVILLGYLLGTDCPANIDFCQCQRWRETRRNAVGPAHFGSGRAVDKMAASLVSISKCW